MNSTAIWLGAISGGTIFLGLPLAFLKNVGPKTRGFLTALSTGILVFLLVEITAKVTDGIEDLLLSVSGGFHTLHDALFYGSIFALGLFIGLMSLVWFEKYFIHARTADKDPVHRAHRLSLMIAIGLGLHNFSEGLAIGQAYGWGNTGLAALLVVGFALHNATEGFGIVGPLAGYSTTWKFLSLTALIGGGPTVLGSLVGSIWTVKAVEVLFLSMASGSILYIIGELLHLGRQLKEETIAAGGLLCGFFLAFITDLIILVSSGGMGRS